MSQAKISTGKIQYPLDAFFQLTVASTTNYKVGEKITGATSGATAKISGIIDATTLRITKMKPGASNNFCGANGATAENITGSIYTTPVNATALTLANKTKRQNSSGTVVLTTDNTYSVDDKGINVTSRNSHIAKQVVTAINRAVSKLQNTDTSVAPTLTLVLPADKTYANGEVLRFVLNSNEALSVSGTPRIAITTLGSAETVYAGYSASQSTAMSLVFVYTLDTSATTAGQIAGIAYNANGATITDVGGAAYTPTTEISGADVTGIIFA